MSEAYKIVVDGLLESVFNNRQFDRAPEFLSPDFLKHYHDGSPSAGWDKVEQEYNALTAKFPEVKATLIRYIEKDDEVWLWTKIEGLPAGHIQEAVEILRLKDGKCFEKWDVRQKTETPRANMPS